MKDYSLNDFQRKSFILRYDINHEKNEIIIYFADGTNKVLPYSVAQEKTILSDMRKQVIDGSSFYEKTLKNVKKYRFRDRIYKIWGAVYIGLFISAFIKSIISAILFLLLTSFSISITKKEYLENKRKLNSHKNMLDDYEKSLCFVTESDNFTNERIIKPNIIMHAPPSVKFIISKGIIEDKYLDFKKNNPDSIPTIEYTPFPEIINIPDDIKENYADAKVRLAKYGYEEIGKREIPYINENSISYIDFDDLYKLKELSKKEEKSKERVLVKIRAISKKDLFKLND